MVKGKYPGLINCLSTNGLSLYDSLPRIAEAGIGTLTVTVNSVDPAVQSFLCAGVAVNGEFYRGSKGAEILIAAQEKGIKGARALGITIKVNMVLVPAINGHRVMEVAKAVSEWGASIINVIPIIPAGPFSNMPAPTAAETEEANQAAGQYLEVMRHCRRCRADACGIPGVSEFSRELYGNSSPVDTFSHG
jgi:nitrogen fixation protein NifB